MTAPPMLLDDDASPLATLDIADVAEHPFLVVHTLTTAVGVNLNRDFDGLPKRLTYGGVERLRVSAQARVRAARVWSRDRINEAQRAVRTRRLPEQVAAQLNAKYGYTEYEAACAAAVIVSATGMQIDFASPHQTTALMFIPGDADTRLAELAHTHRAELSDANLAWQQAYEAWQQANSDKSKRTKEKSIEKPHLDVPNQLIQQARAAFDPGSNLELALYGRMLTNIPNGTFSGATQVAHSISVDPLEEEDDAYTVVDDWQSADVFGSANQGIQQLATGTLYGYAALDRRQLRTNLTNGSNEELEHNALEAERLFVEAMVWAVPTGKHTRTGSAVRPTLTVVGATRKPLTAAAAFETAIEAPASVEASERLGRYLTRNQQRFPLTDGHALWLSPDGSPAPTLPHTVQLEES